MIVTEANINSPVIYVLYELEANYVKAVTVSECNQLLFRLLTVIRASIFHILWNSLLGTLYVKQILVTLNTLNCCHWFKLTLVIHSCYYNCPCLYILTAYSYPDPFFNRIKFLAVLSKDQYPEVCSSTILSAHNKSLLMFVRYLHSVS